MPQSPLNHPGRNEHTSLRRKGRLNDLLTSISTRMRFPVHSCRQCFPQHDCGRIIKFCNWKGSWKYRASPLFFRWAQTGLMAYGDTQVGSGWLSSIVLFLSILTSASHTWWCTQVTGGFFRMRFWSRRVGAGPEIAFLTMTLTLQFDIPTLTHRC